MNLLARLALIGSFVFLIACENEFEIPNVSSENLVGEKPAENLEVLPAQELVASTGQPGGPFLPTSAVVTISNPQPQVISWLVTHDQKWISISKPAGIIPPFSKVEIAVSVNYAANELIPGAYSDTLIFHEVPTDRRHVRSVKLLVKDVCGDNIAGTTEACDGSDLAGKSCWSFGFDSGTLACLSDCSDFDTRNCDHVIPTITPTVTPTVTPPPLSCGNNQADPGEMCDGKDLRLLTCISLGFTSGSLSCNSDCHAFNTALCRTTAPPVVPIGRWDMIPHQRINPNETLNVGIVAFSKNGISKVSVKVVGSIYRGPNPLETGAVALNNQSGVYEYFVPLKASDFASDGIVTLEATIYGADGGIRNKATGGGGLGLDPLPLVVNAKGARPQIEAWVNPSASTSAGVVNDPSRPFKTIGEAIFQIRQYRYSHGFGNNVDGGIVRLSSGTHTNNNGGHADFFANDNEWLTITTAAGGSRSKTILLEGSTPAVHKVRLKGLTLSGGNVIGVSSALRPQIDVWVDDSSMLGSGRLFYTHPVFPTSEWKRLYLTKSSISDVAQATSGAQLCRGLTISRLSDDAFQNVPMVVNALVDDVDPGSTGAHADVWQHGGGNSQNKVDDNVIVYNLRATRLKYQSLFIRGDIYSAPSKAQGMAFVNVYMDMASDAQGWGGWGRWVDHLLWWNMTFRTAGMGFMTDNYAGGSKQLCQISNFSAKGNNFAFLYYTGAVSTNWSGWDNNHFVDASEGMGAHKTFGNDGLDSYGRPVAGSPLLDRLGPFVPSDAGNKLRIGLGDIGAYEK